MSGEQLQGLIVVLVPMLVGLLKVLLPSLPKRAIPAIVIVGGGALQLGAAYGTGTAISPEWAAVLGASSIGLRELVDQARALAGDLGAGK